MESLLGHFSGRINGKAEDIASEGLAYVLRRSPIARQALNKIIQMDSGLVFEDINYSTQNVGEKLERPDISGMDKNGKEVIILEAKFWAALTDNQPVEYLNRLEGNSVLIFIVPTLRVRPIFNKLKKRLADAGIEFVPDNANHSFSLERNQKLIVKTWKEILGIIRLHLEQANEQTSLSDIGQIIGFCETIDNTSFQPFQSEDFAPSIAKKINSYIHITSKIVDELNKKEKINNDGYGIHTNSHKYGQLVFFRIKTVGFTLFYHSDLWEKAADTPIWLKIQDDTTNIKSWKLSESVKAKIKNVATKKSIIPYEDVKSRDLFLPLFPPLHQTEDLVIKDMANQIIELVDELLM